VICENRTYDSSSDCSGGAGIQADIKTITAHKLYAMSAITALTAQNTTGVSAILDVAPDFVAKQIDAIFTDIYPDAVKKGMVSNADIISIIAINKNSITRKTLCLIRYGFNKRKQAFIPEALDALINKLSYADIITPNLLEAQCLAAMTYIPR
jgi:hydroxymethylpyrimidine/phosphomethylpyrimidine kinase